MFALRRRRATDSSLTVNGGGRAASGENHKAYSRRFSNKVHCAGNADLGYLPWRGLPRFYDTFIQRGVVFGDLPALPLDEFSIDDDRDLLRYIAISEKVRAFYADPSRKNAPSRNPRDYDRYSWTGSRLNRKGVVSGLYSRAKQGDLVLLTSEGQAWGTTRIGEFRGEPSDVVYERFARYGDERIPARQVRWIGRIDNRQLPQEVVKQLTSPNAFTLLARSHYDQIFSAAYENYFRSTDASNSLLDIKAEKFSTVPDMHLKIIANFAAEISRAIDGRNLDEALNRTLDDWLVSLQEDEFSAAQKIRINSPGQNVLQCAKMTPILAAVLFALMQFPAPDVHGAQLSFKNSANGGPLDQCDIPVADAAQLVFKTISLDRLEKMCKIAEQAKTLGKIVTPITTTDMSSPTCTARDQALMSNNALLSRTLEHLNAKEVRLWHMVVGLLATIAITTLANWLVTLDNRHDAAVTNRSQDLVSTSAQFENKVHDYLASGDELSKVDRAKFAELATNIDQQIEALNKVRPVLSDQATQVANDYQSSLVDLRDVLEAGEITVETTQRFGTDALAAVAARERLMKLL